ncbi:MAG: COX15/CtaA family protein [Hyphomicrobiales bacterium]|nr:COX15/CtaA family protein [Hyphomicrobiales bacterium]
MTDWMYFPETAPRSAPLDNVRAGSLGAVRGWLWFMAAMVFVMVLIGGATRLTESGLSITEWKPVTGALPPLSQGDWLALFAKYKQIPQYKQLFPDMTLAHFKYIYFWEWAHRLHARLVGLEMALPLLWFWLRGAISGRFALKLFSIGVLIGLQGLVGWYMVKSGLTRRVEVSQYLLALHLLLASFTFACIVWQAAGLGVALPSARASSLRPWALVLAVLVFIQIGFGALVAGLRAGLVNNTWPLMDGHLLLPLQVLLQNQPLWRNFFDNVVTVQFQHRMLAYGVVLFVLAYAWRASAADRAAARRAGLLAGLVACQVALGIVTLVLVVPLWAGLLHQSFAFILFGTTIYNLRALFQPAFSAASRSAVRSA